MLPATTYAGSREAVQKAIAATVTVEWRTDEKTAQQQPEAVRSVIRHRLPDADAQAGDADPQRRAAAVLWRRTATRPAQADLALASGVVVSANGLVVTSNREPDGHYVVIFADGRSLPARVVVDDRRSGLRLLKVDAADLPHLTPADSEAEIGDQVFAAFSTDRHERAAAQGMVAARPKTGLIELDLATGPMSAGGPLVNEQGGLVGIISGGAAPAARTQTGNSAVPVKDVCALLTAQQGENTVVVHRGFLGLQLDSKPEGGRERVIVHLMDDSPARAAGVIEGDELVTVAGEKITSPAEAAALVARHAPGEKVAVAVLRDGQPKAMEIVLGRPPAALESAQTVGTQGGNRSTGGGSGTANIVHPEKLYILSEDGKQVVVAADGEQVNALRNYARALRLQSSTASSSGSSSTSSVAAPATNAIRVERSDLDKKLEEVGRSVESLQQQVKKLTEEIQTLSSKLAETK
jgi:S1-C subfamily serine protease